MAKKNKNKKTSKSGEEISREERLPEGAFDRAVLSWYAPQYLRFRKGVIWYVVAGLINFLLLGYAIWTNVWSMAVVFALLPLVFLIENKNKPQAVKAVISQFGIKFGVLQVPFSDVRSFWILHDPPYVDELHILTNDRLHPELIIPLVGTDPAIVRQYLVTQIPEWEGKKQSLLEMIVRALRLN